MATFRDYVRQCAQQAPTSWRKGSVMMSLLISLGLFAALLIGWQLDKYPTSYFLVGTGLIAAFDLLAIFPYQLWKNNQTEIDDLKERLRSKLEFIGLKGKSDPGWVYHTEIKNGGPQHLDNCLVKIERIEVTDGKAVSATMPLVLRTSGQIEGDRSGRFNLSGGEKKPVKCVYQANTASGWIGIDYEGGQLWLHEVRRCILHLAAYGSESPATAAIEVWLDLNNHNRLNARMIK